MMVEKIRPVSNLSAAGVNMSCAAIYFINSRVAIVIFFELNNGVGS